MLFATLPPLLAAGMAAGYIALLLPAAGALWSVLLPDWDRGLIAMGVNALVAVMVIALTGSPAKTSQVQGVRPA